MIPTTNNLVLISKGGTIVNPPPTTIHTLSNSSTVDPTSASNMLPVHSNLILFQPLTTTTAVYGRPVMAVAPVDNTSSSVVPSTPVELSMHVMSPTNLDGTAIDTAAIPSAMPGTYSPAAWLLIAVVVFFVMTR